MIEVYSNTVNGQLEHVMGKKILFIIYNRNDKKKENM